MSEGEAGHPLPLPSAGGTIPTQGRNEAGARRGEVTHAENFKANLQGDPYPSLFRMLTSHGMQRLMRVRVCGA